MVHLRPTTPLKAHADIDRAIAILEENEEAHAVRSMCESHHTPFKAYRFVPDHPYATSLLKDVYPDVFSTTDDPSNMPRQAFPKVWRHSGYVDVIKRHVICNMNSMSGKNLLPLFIESWRDVDIDSHVDLFHAEHIINIIKKYHNLDPWEHIIESPYDTLRKNKD